MWWVAALLPAAWAARLGSRLLQYFGPRSRKHKHVLRNLAIVQTSASQDERNETAIGVWGNLGAVLFEYPHLEQIYQHHVTCSIAPEVQALFDKHQPVMLATAHLANWEILGPFMDVMSKGMTAIYGPQDNGLIENMIQRFRARGSRCVWVKKQDALRTITQEFLNGSSLGLLLDVRVDSGVTLPFFDVDAPTTISPARLALRLGYPIVPARVKRLGPARFEIEMLPPLHTQQEGRGKLAALDLTAQYNAILERWILERPAEWLCTKRRWPKATAAADGSNVC